MFEPPFPEQEPDKGTLIPGVPSPLRGLPLQPLIPTSPLDLFAKRSIVGPDVPVQPGSSQQAPSPIQHAPFSPAPVDNTMHEQGQHQLDLLLPGLAKFGKKEMPDADELLNRIKIATALESLSKPKAPATQMPEVSADRAKYYATAAKLESGDRDDAVNPAYPFEIAAAGRFQFSPKTVASMREQNPELAKHINAKWRTDPVQQHLLMDAYTNISDTLIKQITGDEPTNDKRYAMHLFGHGTGSKLIANPTAPIESLFPSKAAFDEAVRVNRPIIRPGMTGQDFLAWAAPRFGSTEQ